MAVCLVCSWGTPMDKSQVVQELKKQIGTFLWHWEGSDLYPEEAAAIIVEQVIESVQSASSISSLQPLDISILQANQREIE